MDHRPAGSEGRGGEEVYRAMVKMRVYEVAKDLGLSNQDVLARARSLGIDARNHMSSVDAEDAARIRRAIEKDRHDNTVEERVSSTVIRRRAKGPLPGAPSISAQSTSPLAPLVSSVEPPVVSGRAAAEARWADVSARPASSVATVDAEPASSPRSSEPPVSEEAERPAPRVTTVVRELEVRPRRTSMATERGASIEVIQVSRPRTGASTAAAPSTGNDGGSARDLERSEQTVSSRPAARVVTPDSSTSRVADSYGGADERGAGSIAAHAPSPGENTDAAAAAPARVPSGPRVIELTIPSTPRIQITEVPKVGAVPRGREVTQKRDLSGRDRFARTQPQTRRGAKRPVVQGKKSKQTQITTPAAHKMVVKMEETIAVSELAREMSVKATEVLKKLWGMGMVGVNINQSIDADTAQLLASEFGYTVQSVAFQEAEVISATEDNADDLVTRAPVVTIMGHVDHGKTSLLDAIREANVAGGESGGITQHIGAYRVASEAGDVVFLDTPGHEAFTAMRARGAEVTDIVVLVVAADDGPMPQTIEAINHAKAAEVPIVVAINKVDKPGAQPDRIRQQLSEHGLVAEQWGGDTIFVEVSARTKAGVPELLEMLAVQAEVLELKANPDKPARGTVIEARLDRNRGPISTVLVQDGTLKLGDTIIAGEQMGKVRAMLDDKGRTLSEAPPSTPVEILGLDGVPEAGEVLNAVVDEKSARSLIEHRRDQRRKKDLSGATKVTLENILQKIEQGQAKELKVVLKADVQGSVEAMRDALIRLSTDQVKVNVISSGVGGITETDVNLARASGAVVLGFRVRTAGKATALAEHDHVDIKLYEIIYEALDDVKKAMVGLLAPVKRERSVGRVEVREVFTIPKVGAIAGCSVLDGKVLRSSAVRLVRDSVPVFTGKISSLRRFKDDVREVVQGYECGIGLEGFNDIKIGDTIEAFEIVEEAPTL
jgi:translation initiation factor IF-2